MKHLPQKNQLDLSTMLMPDMKYNMNIAHVFGTFPPFLVTKKKKRKRKRKKKKEKSMHWLIDYDTLI